MFIPDTAGVERHLKEVQPGGGEVFFSPLHTLWFTTKWSSRLVVNLKKMHLICRILVVKQKGKVLSPLNATLVDVVVRSLLPSSPTRLSASEVSHAIEEHLQTKEDDVWIGWTVKTPTREEREREGVLRRFTVPDGCRLEGKYPRTWKSCSWC